MTRFLVSLRTLRILRVQKIVNLCVHMRVGALAGLLVKTRLGKAV